MTLSNAELERAFDAMDLPEAGRALVRSIRQGRPARAVGTTSISGRHVSTKSRHTVQYESRSGEGFACLLYEGLPEVRWFCDQPQTFLVPYAVPGSKRTQVEHTPDFLVIREERTSDGSSKWSITFEEWRMSRRLERLAQGDPGRWSRRPDGSWTQKPVEEYLAELGLGYRVHVIDELPPLLARNFDLLADHFVEAHQVDPERRAAAIGHVEAHPGCTLREVLEAVAGLSVDDAFALIAQRALHVDLGAALLTDHDHVQLYGRPEVAAVLKRPSIPVERGEVVVEAGARMRWGDKTCEVLNVTDAEVFYTLDGRGAEAPRRDFLRWVEEGKIVGLSDGRQDLSSRILEKDPQALETANQRLAIIEPFLRTGTYPVDRTHQRWIADYRRAETLYGSGLLGLVPNCENSGNRDPRLGEDTEELAAKVIKEQLLRPDQLSIRKAHDIFIQECDAKGVPHMGRSTFYERFKLIKQADRLRARVGNKAAAGAAMRSGAASPLSRHGDYPYARVHIDWTLLDLMTVDSKTGEVNGRPGLTLAVCARSRKIVGKVLAYGAPSTRTLLLMARDLVARNGKLPTTIITDNGKEFRSTYWQTLMAAFKVRLEYRRGGVAKDGGPIEAALRKLHTDLIYTLVGNTQITKKVRAMAPANSPVHRAIWTYDALNQAIDEYIELHNATVVPALGASPNDIFEKDMALAGERAFRRIALTPAFRALTALTPLRSPRAKVTRKGVRVNNLDYWCEAMALPGVEGTYVDVRFEPFNARIAYAKINGVWHVCHADYQELEGRTDKEIVAASIELRARLGKTPTNYELARHLQKVQEREKELAEDQRRRLRRAREEAPALAAHAETEAAPVERTNAENASAPVVDEVEDDLTGYLAPSKEDIADLLGQGEAEVAA